MAIFVYFCKKEDNWNALLSVKKNYHHKRFNSRTIFKNFGKRNCVAVFRPDLRKRKEKTFENK